MVVDAGTSGGVLDCDSDGLLGVLAADVIRRVCHTHAGDVDPRGLRLRNAIVTGALDLRGMTVPFPIWFDGCEFDSPLLLDGARLPELTVTDSRLPGLSGNGLRVTRDIDLSRSRITVMHDPGGESDTDPAMTRPAAVRLCDAAIGGRLLCVGTEIDAAGELAVHADRVHVGGSVLFTDDCTALGGVRLPGARIDGSVDLTGAHLKQPVGRALDLADAVVGGDVHVLDSTRRPVVYGGIDLSGARVAGRLTVRNAELTRADRGPTDDVYWRRSPEDAALSGPRLHVGGEVAFEGACLVTGGLDLSSCDVGDLVFQAACRLAAPRTVALDLTNAELRSTLTLQTGTRVEGTLCLSGARVHGAVTLRGTSWRSPSGTSLVTAQGATVAGDVELHDILAVGGRLRFAGCVLGGALDARGAWLDNPAGETVSLDNTVVRGSVRLDKVVSTGSLVLARCTVDGELRCTEATLVCPESGEDNADRHALRAGGTKVRGGVALDWARVTPSVDLTDLTTTVLADDPANWPPRLVLSGLTYDTFGGQAAEVWQWRPRVAWLARQPEFDPGPYQQTARVLHQHGYPGDAEEILIAQRNRAGKVAADRPDPAATTGTEVVRRTRHAGHVLFGWTAGYGYRPGRVLGLLAALVVAVLLTVVLPPGQDSLRATDTVGAVYTPSGPVAASTAPADACGDGRVRCLNPVFFAVDTVVPLVSLDQRSTWYPDARAPWGEAMDVWLNIATLLGWLLTSVFVLSLVRSIRTS